MPARDPRYAGAAAGRAAAHRIAEGHGRRASCPTGTTPSRRRSDAGKRVLIAAHGNSPARAREVSRRHLATRTIVELNIPTGIPLVYELDEQLEPIAQPLSRRRRGGGRGRGRRGRAAGAASRVQRACMHVDVFIAGGGLAGLTLARQLQREAPASARARRREAHASGAAKRRSRSASRASRSARTTSGSVLGLEPHLRARQLEKLGLRYFFPHGDNRDLARARRARPAAISRRCRRSSSIAGGSRTICSRPIARAGVDGARRLRACATITLGEPHHVIEFETADGARDRRGALDRRRQRPRRPDPAAARPDAPSDARAPTPAGGASSTPRRASTTGRRSGVAGARADRASAGRAPTT